MQKDVINRMLKVSRSTKSYSYVTNIWKQYIFLFIFITYPVLIFNISRWAQLLPENLSHWVIPQGLLPTHSLFIFTARVICLAVHPPFRDTNINNRVTWDCLMLSSTQIKLMVGGRIECRLSPTGSCDWGLVLSMATMRVVKPVRGRVWSKVTRSFEGRSLSGKNIYFSYSC